MTDQSQLAQLQALLAQAQPQATMPTTGWTQPQPAALPITGISIPVKIETPMGSVRVDLHLPAECGQSPQALLGAIQALAHAGYPVDAWQPRQEQGGWGNSSSGWGNRNSYSNRNSYGRRW